MTEIEIYDKLQAILPPFIKSKFAHFVNMTDDIINEVYIKIVTKGNYDSSKDLSKRHSYFTTICKNYIIDYMRREKSRKKRNTDYSRKNGYIHDAHFDTDYEIETDYKYQLKNIITELTRVEQFLIQKIYVEKKSKMEMQTYLKISRQTLNRYLIKINMKIADKIDGNEILLEFLKDSNIEHKTLSNIPNALF